MGAQVPNAEASEFIPVMNRVNAMVSAQCGLPLAAMTAERL